MKPTRIKSAVKPAIFLCLFGATAFSATAQSDHDRVLKFSLGQAVQYAKESNKLVEAMKIEEAAVKADLEDARIGALPRILTNASYQRYTRVTLFDGVIGDPHGISKPPNSNAGNLGLEASFNLYSGGRQGYLVTDIKHKTELASINTQEQTANIGLQVTLQYLDMVRFYFQEQLIEDQVSRAQIRVKNIATFYTNGKVTKSDLLRAEVLLSNIILSETANTNDYLISNQKLNTLLNLAENIKIIPVDTASLHLPDSLEIERLLNNYPHAYPVLKAQKNIELQSNRTRLSRSFNYPTISVFGGYGFNYPNTLVFPPVPQTFAVGVAGVRLTYDISSFYANKNKIKSSRLREEQFRQQKDWIEDNIQQEVRALAIKYKESIDRMAVIKKSIEQAEINYNIQSTKYFNQLSLLTDLLEADNLYQESRLNYIQANIAALSIYYRLLFITGNL